MRTLVSEDRALKHVISVGREDRGLVCVGIQDGRSWASDLFKVEALGHAVEHLEKRLGKTARKEPKGTGRFGDVE